MVFTLFNLIEVIWLIIPAYAVNGLIPLIGLRGREKNHPIDGGRNFRGKPLLGPGKTWEGLIFGCFIGIFIASVEMLAFPYIPFDISPVPLTIVPMFPLFGLLLGVGTVIGDMTGSFIKRRIGLPRGSIAPLLDQEDFLLGSLLFASFMVAIKIDWVILLVIITPIIHLIASAIGFKMKVKKEPW
jgi:CDP-2,3-bis-(O-geranylgeranyl)-sn-glycerol synthase